MRHLLRERGLEDRVVLDSAGTGGWHVGSPPDERSAAAAARRGIDLEGAARQVEPADFSRFDLLVAMDRSNRDDLLALAPDASARGKVRLLLGEDDVPDPYYGGPRGFDDVLDLVHEACESLLDEVADALPAIAVSFAKAGLAPGEAATEAAGLRWLAEAGALPVPEVLDAGDDRLVIERVETGRWTAAHDEALGRGLAALHAAGAPAFGALPPGAPGPFRIGAAELPSAPADRWPRFTPSSASCRCWAAPACRPRGAVRSRRCASGSRTWPARTSPRPAARRPVGGQRPGRRRRAAVAGRPRRARRPPRDRPGDAAPLRRAVRALLRRLRRGRAARRRLARPDRPAPALPPARALRALRRRLRRPAEAAARRYAG